MIRRRVAPWLLLLLALGPILSRAQTPTPPPSAASATPGPSPSPSPSPAPGLSLAAGIRNKLAAGDLLSAESLVEVYRQQHGDDAQWLGGLAWLARGALLLGDLDKAKLYASQTRSACADRIAHGADVRKDHDLEIALGAAIEVEAQRLQRTQGARKAAAFARAEAESLPDLPALRSRIQKRVNLMTLEGQMAPELVIEDAIGPAPPSLASLRGKPVVLFVWAEWCADCRAQEAALAKARARHAKDVTFLTLTRYYDEPEKRATEKARVDSVWNAIYADVGTLPSVISTASMIRYGGSSTPTFVFIDRRGIVRSYTPTRLTEAELERRIAMITR